MRAKSVYKNKPRNTQHLQGCTALSISASKKYSHPKSPFPRRDHAGATAVTNLSHAESDNDFFHRTHSLVAVLVARCLLSLTVPLTSGQRTARAPDSYQKDRYLRCTELPITHVSVDEPVERVSGTTRKGMCSRTDARHTGAA